jgi:FkbM family methyltransferase
MLPAFKKRGAQMVRARLESLLRSAKAIGVAATAHYAAIRFARHDGLRILHPARTTHPLWVRTRSSDLELFSQIFIWREYDCLDLTDGDLIIDLGANVGYSSAYFLSRYPKSPVIAVEPDPSNFAILQRNLAAYGPRVTVIQAAVWSHATKVSIRAEPYRTGGASSRQVAESKSGDIAGVDIPSLLALAQRSRIGLLKVDIEGAEVVIFGGKSAWLNQVDRIAIELHDDSVFGNATEVFYNAIDGQNFEISQSGELTICSRL